MSLTLSDINGVPIGQIQRHLINSLQIHASTVLK